MGASLDFKISLRTIMEAALFLHFHALKKVRGSGSGASQAGKEGWAFTYWGLSQPGAGGARVDHSGASEAGRVGFYILGRGL